MYIKNLLNSQYFVILFPCTLDRKYKFFSIYKISGSYMYDTFYRSNNNSPNYERHLNEVMLY